ncbi:hypothetical protein ACWGJX_47800 [Streptomyces sp. NPDC054775]
MWLAVNRAGHASGDVLATNSSLRVEIKADTSYFYRSPSGELYREDELSSRQGADWPEEIHVIPEIVTPPMAATALDSSSTLSARIGLRDLDSVRSLLSLPDTRGRPMPLADIFRSGSGWKITEKGKNFLVGTFPSGIHSRENYVQYTVGVPSNVMHGLLTASYERTTGPRAFLRYFIRGAALGEQVAAAYATRILGRPVAPREVPFLSHLSGVQDLRGYLWQVGTHAGANVISSKFEGGLVKNRIPLLIRNPMKEVLKTLTPEARRFLADNHEQIARAVKEWVQYAVQDYGAVSGRSAGDISGIFDEPSLIDRSITTSDYISYSLTGSAADGRKVKQWSFIGTKDFHVDRVPRVPHLLLEIRHYGAGGTLLQMNSDQVQDGFRFFQKSVSLELESMNKRNSLPQDPVSNQLLLDHPALKSVAPLLESLQEFRHVPGSNGMRLLVQPIMPATVIQEIADRITRSIIYGRPDVAIYHTLSHYRQAAIRNASTGPYYPGIDTMYFSSGVQRIDQLLNFINRYLRF